MKKTLFLVFSLFLFLAGFAQKIINDPNAELRKVSGFHAIEISSGIDLYISQGDEAVAVSAKEKQARDRIRVEVKDGVLKIGYDWKDGLKISIGGNNEMKAYVSCKTLDRLVASGGSDVLVDGSIQGNQLTVHLSGGADFTGKVDVSVLTVNQSGGSDVNISGTASTISIEASGGSDFDGYDLVSNDCTIHASGGSDINITVNKVLDAEASGASDISWKGSATVKKAKASGAGSVSHRS
jgi:hypothetical protein